MVLFAHTICLMLPLLITVLLFTSALILTLDGVGEWATTSLWKGEGNHIEQIAEIDILILSDFCILQ